MRTKREMSDEHGKNTLSFVFGLSYRPYRRTFATVLTFHAVYNSKERTRLKIILGAFICYT